MAVALALGGRIAARVNAEQLRREVGDELASQWAAEARGHAARQLAHQALAQEVAATAAALGIGPVVLLKGAALDAAGVLPPGGRGASDLDLLVPRARAAELVQALEARGLHRGREPAQEHQLPTLYRGRLALELHHHLPGVTPPGGSRFATVEDLLAADALEPSGALFPGCHHPRRPWLVAHALAHGIAQHGWTPEGYPALRLLADLADLGLAAAGGEALAAQAQHWLGDNVSPAELVAAHQLTCRLVAGNPASAPEDDAGRLLRHFLAGALDLAYRQALKLNFLAPPLSDRGPLRAGWAALRRTVWLSDAQIDHIYGAPRHAWGYTARRLARPFDLTGRLARALWQRWRLPRSAG